MRKVLRKEHKIMKKRTIITVILSMFFLCSCQSSLSKNNYNKTVKGNKSASTIVDKSKKIDTETLMGNSSNAIVEKKNSEKELPIQVNFKALNGKTLEFCCIDIVEDDDNLYYCTKEEIIKIHKKDGISNNILKQQNPSKLAIYNGYLYFLSDGGADLKFYRVDINGENYSEVFNRKDITGKYLTDIRSFQVVENKIYVDIMMQLFSYDMNTGEIVLISKDIYKFHVVGDNVYFTDHAQRTFTFYKLNLRTMEREIFLGNGVSMPEKELYDDFVFIGKDLYYTVRKTRGIFGLYCYDGEKSTAISDNVSAWISNLIEYKGNLYYIIKQGDGKANLMRYNITKKEITQVAELKDNKTAYRVRIVNGTLYYNTGDGEVRSRVLIK